MINKIILKQNHSFYQEGPHFEDPRLKYLTKQDVSKLIQKIIHLDSVFPNEDFVRTFKQHDYQESSFKLDSAFDYQLTKQDVLNPTDNKLKDLFAYLSHLLFDSEEFLYENLTLFPIKLYFEYKLSYNQLVELLEHLAYPELVGYTSTEVHRFSYFTLRKSPFGVHITVKATNNNSLGFYNTSSIKTLDCQKSIEDIKTVTELKEFVNSLDDSDLRPNLTMGFIYDDLDK